MKNIFEQRVYYADTDSYGVVWHGAYLRWMEAARCEFCRDLNVDLIELSKNDIVIPVTNVNLRYKSSAKVDEKIVVETEVIKISPISMTFKQVIKNSDTQQVHVIAEVTVVAIHNDGSIYRHLPEEVSLPFKEGLACSV